MAQATITSAVNHDGPRAYTTPAGSGRESAYLSAQEERKPRSYGHLESFPSPGPGMPGWDSKPRGPFPYDY